jgi:hypothetical protein
VVVVLLLLVVVLQRKICWCGGLVLWGWRRRLRPFSEAVLSGR